MGRTSVGRKRVSADNVVPFCGVRCMGWDWGVDGVFGTSWVWPSNRSRRLPAQMGSLTYRRFVWGGRKEGGGGGRSKSGGGVSVRMSVLCLACLTRLTCQHVSVLFRCSVALCLPPAGCSQRGGVVTDCSLPPVPPPL